MEYKFLNQINFPDDLRKFKIDELKHIANELRLKTINAVPLYEITFRRNLSVGPFLKLMCDFSM